MMVPRIASALVIATLVTWNARESEAVVIFSNPLDNTLFGVFSNHGDVNFQMGASSFVLDGRGTLTDVHWFGYFAAPVPNPTFRVRLYDDDGGLPGTLRYEEVGSPMVMDTGLTTSHAGINVPVFEFSLDPLTPFSLDAGVTHWISITHSATGVSEWLWSRSSDFGDLAFGHSLSDTWDFRSDGALAFSITGALVPEPSGLVLLGAGALVLFRYTRRRG